MFTANNFPYVDYLKQVQGATDADIPEDGLTEDQKQRAYALAVSGFRKELQSRLPDKKTARRQAIEDTINRFDGAREILGIPQPDFAPETNLEGLIDHFGNIPNNEVLHNRTLGDLAGKFADRFTKGDRAYFEFEQFRGDENITTDDHRKSILNGLDQEFESSVSPFTKDTILKDAIDMLASVRVGADPQTVNALPEVVADNGVIENLGRGTAAGFLDLAGKTIEGISTLGNTLALKAGIGDVRLFTESDDGEFQLFRMYSPDELESAFAQQGTLSNDFIGRVGQSIQDVSTDVNQGADQDSISNKIGNIVGQVAGFITSGITTGPAGALSTAVLSGSEFQLDDYESVLLSGDQKFDSEEAQNVALLGGAIGTLESIPVFKALGRLNGTNTTPKILKWLDDNSDGGILKLIKNATGGAIEEGLQEVVSQVASNLIASDIVAYDPSRDLFQGATEAGATGAAAGGVLNSLLGFIGGKRSVTNNPPGVEVVELDPDDVLTLEPLSEPAITPPKIITTPTGSVTAVNGRLIVGNNRVDVEDQLQTQLASFQALGASADIDAPEVEQTGRTASVKDESGQTIVTFDGKQSTSQLERLIEQHNDQDSDFTLYRGTKIKDNGDNFIVSLGAHKFTVDSIDEGIANIKTAIESTGVASRINVAQIEQAQPVATFEVEQPIGRKKKDSSGFRPPRFKDFPTRRKDMDVEKFNEVKLKFARDRLGGDFNVASVTPTQIIATKDGLNYEINIGRKTTVPNQRRRKGAVGNSIVANVIVTDKQGSLVENPVNQNVPLTNIKGDLVNTRFTVATPQVGFRIIRDTRVGEQLPPKLDASNIEAVAKRTGGTVISATPEHAQIKYDNNENVSIIIDPETNGALVHLEDGQVLNVDSGVFTLQNNVDSASVITSRLIDNGYQIKSQKGKRTTLLNQKLGKKVTVVDNGFDATILEGKKERTLDTLTDEASLEELESQSFDLTTIPQEVATSEQTPDGPATANAVQARIDDTLSKVQIIDGKPTVVNPDGSRTIYEVEEGELRDLLFDIETTGQSGEFTNLSIAPKGELLSLKDDWDHADLQNLVDTVFHPRVAAAMKLHDRPNPGVFGVPTNGFQTLGFFAPNSDGSGRYIHVDASKQRGNLHRVLDTISEEVAHFGFDTFALPQFDKLYENLYSIVKPEILASDNMQLYIKRSKVNVNDPSPAHRYMLVNEYFSKLGVSFMDFEGSLVDLPAGLDKVEFQKIKEAVQNARVDDVVIDLAKDVTPSMKDEAAALIRNVIRLQTSAVRGVGFNVQFETSRNDGTPGTVRIRSTPYGRASSFTPDTSAAKRIRALKDLHHKRGEYSKMSKPVWQVVKFIKSLNFTNTPIGRERTVSISETFSNESRVRAEGLRVLLRKRRRLDKVIRDFNIPALTPNDSYHTALINAGVKNKKTLRLAEEMDGFLKVGSAVKFDNVAKIHNEFRRAKDQLKKWAINDTTGRLALELPGRIQQLDNEQARYTADWSHRRYDAQTQQGLKRLEMMLSELESDIRGRDSSKSPSPTDDRYVGTLNDQRLSAQAQIEAIQNDPDDTGTNANRKIAELNEMVVISERLQALYEYVLASEGTADGRADQETVQDAMRRRLAETIRRNKQRSRIGTGKLNQIDANQSQTLDVEGNEADMLLAKFLGPLTDPAESMIFDLEQQGQIYSALRSANQLAIELVDDTIARPQGLATGDFTVDSKSNLLGDAQKGTLLEFIEVDSLFVDHIQDQLGLYANIQFTWLNNLIGEFKRNLTVRSGFGITSSYVGNLSMMASSGHIFTLRGLQSLAPNIKDAWALRFNASFDGEDGIGKIAKEMAERNLLGTGNSTATVEFSQTNTIKKITDLITRYVQSDKVELIGDAVQRVDDTIAKVFSFSDDFSKVLPYMMNRELGVLEAEQSIKRQQFDNNEFGEEKYRAAIDDFASRFAAERTRRETVNWELAPSFFRKIGTSNVRLFTPDFVGHMIQMIRTLTENHVLIVEDIKNARLNNKIEGNEQLAAHYRNAALRRAIGTSINDVIWAGLSTGSYSVLADLMRGLWQQIDTEDDPNLPLKDRTNYNDEEWEAAKGMARIYSIITGQVFDAAPFRDGEKAAMMGNQRSNASLSFAVPGSIDDFQFPSTGREFAEAAQSFIKNFLAIDDETIVNTLYRSWFLGLDKFGRPTTTSDKIKDGLRLATPQMLQQAHQVARGERLFSQAKVNQMYAFATNVGFPKMREVPYPRIINMYGQNLRRFKSSSTSAQPKAMVDKLIAGDNLSDAQVRDLVASYQRVTDRKFQEATAAIGYMKGVGFSNKRIRQLLRVDPNGVTKNGIGKADAESLVKGENFFNAAMRRSLENRLKSARKAKPTSDRLDAQQLANNVSNLTRALGYYK